MVSVQIIKPSSIKGGGSSGGGGGSSGGGGNKSFAVESDTSDTVIGALRGLLSKVGKRVYLGSAQVIIFGEGIVKTGIGEYLDFILRDHRTQYKTQVIVAKDSTAKEILEQEYELSNLSGVFILDTLQNAGITSFSKKMMLIEMARELVTEGKSLSVGTIEKSGKTTAVEGLAVFKKDKLFGWLDKYETRGYMFITNKAKKGIIEVEDPNDSNKKVSFELTDLSSKYIVKLDKNNMPEATVKIKAKGKIAEMANSKVDHEYMNAVNEYFKAKIREDAQNAIKKCQQEYKSDIFGFGMRMFQNHPEYWSKSKDKWHNEIFPNIEVNVEVDGKITNSGMLFQSMELK